MSAISPGTQSTLGEAFQRAAEAAQTAEEAPEPEDGPEPTEDLACGHGRHWAESGTCMACDARVGASATVAERQQLGDDAGGGRL